MSIKKQSVTQTGFTILEIIIVVVILSVLVSLSIPKFGSMIERSRSTEAIIVLTNIRFLMEKCYLMSSNYARCTTIEGNPFSHLGLNNPTNNVNSHFSYFIRGASISSYFIVAQRNTYELLSTIIPADLTCGIYNSAGSSEVGLCRISDGTVSILGSGLYNGIDTTPR